MCWLVRLVCAYGGERCLGADLCFVPECVAGGRAIRGLGDGGRKGANAKPPKGGSDSLAGLG